MTAAKTEFFKEHPEFFVDIPRLKEHLQLLTGNNEFTKFRPELTMPVFNNGLVIGRFHPPHPGHFYLIQQALTFAKRITIGIGSANVKNQNNPFPSSLREHLLWEGLRERQLDQYVSGIVYLNDYINDDFWLQEALRKTGKVDVVVGNNDWVNGIFQRSGIRTQEIPLLERHMFQGAVIRQVLRKEGILRDV